MRKFKMTLKNKEVLVTGAGGFIGSHLTEKLVNLGANVTALTNIGEINYNFLNKIHTIQYDIRDKKLRGQIKDYELIFHLAALTNRNEAIKEPEKAFDINTFGTINILEGCKNSKIKGLIYLSTAGVYGIPTYFPINEEHPTTPLDPYSASKLSGENAVLSYSSIYKFPATILRGFNVYGPKQNNDFVIPKIIDHILNKNEVILGNIDSTRDFIYIDDFVDGIMMAAECGGQKIYNLGSGVEISIKNVAEKVRALACKENIIKTKDYGKSGILRSVADISKIKKETGWKPKINLEDGLMKTLNYYKSH